MTEERRALLNQVRARRWNGAQLESALERFGWADAALARIRGIGSWADGEQEADTRWTKTIKRWLRDRQEIDPKHQEWLERVLAVAERGPSLLDGPPGPMTAERLREIASRLEWDTLADAPDEGERIERDGFGREILVLGEEEGGADRGRSARADRLRSARAAAGRGGGFALFGDVLGVPQERVQAMARGEEPLPAPLGEALESIMDGVREGRWGRDGGGEGGG